LHHRRALRGVKLFQNVREPPAAAIQTAGARRSSDVRFEDDFGSLANWQRGAYRVDFFVGATKVATGSFDID